MTQTETLARIQARLDACDWAAAEPLCRSALGVFGNAALLHAMLGYVCQQTGRDEEALEHCADALGRDKACWLACRVQTLSRLALGRLKGAEESAEAELRLTPLDPGSFALRAEVAARIAGPAAAIAAYAAAPAALREKVTAGRLEAAIQRGLSLAAATDLSAIRSRLNTGDLAGAEALIRQSLERFPELGELYGLLAYCLQQQTRFEEAIAASAAATDMSPDDWLALLSRGLAERALGRLTAARAVFGHAALLHPSDDGVRLNLVETTLRTRGFEATRSVIAAIPPGARGDKLSRLWRTLLVDHGEREERPSGETEIVARIEPARGWAARHDIQIVEAGPVEEIPFAEPRIWGGPEPEPPILIRGFSPYVVELPNATIASRSSLVLTRDDCLLNDVGGDADYGAFVDWSYDKRVLAQSGRTVMIDKAGYEVAEIEGGAMLAGLASDAFGHWVPEYLSRLAGLEQHPAFRELPIIVDAEMPAPHFEYLQLVCDRPLLRLPPNTAFRCRRLLYAPPPLFFPVELVAGHALPRQTQGALSPTALRMLRERVLRRLPPRSPDAIAKRAGRGRWFLGRRNLRWRRLLNEAEVAAALEPIGFETAYAEDLTLAQQIALFQDADAIVAPNGSSLLNLIFAPTEIPTIVLSQSRTFNWGGFQGPMEALGYRPLWVCGRKDDSAGKHADYSVDPSSIIEALASLGVHRS